MGVVLNIEKGKRDAASIKDLIDLTAADMARVNELILSKAGSDVEMIPEVANHLISSGGKRLRPMLTLAAAQMFGYSGRRPRQARDQSSSSCTPRRCCMTTSSTKATCAAARRPPA